MRNYWEEMMNDKQQNPEENESNGDFSYIRGTRLNALPMLDEAWEIDVDIVENVIKDFTHDQK